MYKLYNGLSGKSRWVPDAYEAPSPQRPPEPKPPGARPGDPIGSIAGRLGQLIPKTIKGLETEDLILLLILYLMYRDSGDSELLIMMGAMFLL